MKRFAMSCAGLLFALGLFSPSSAQAQLGETWVASNGTDTGDCDILHPCFTIGYTYSQTSPGGSINCAGNTGVFMPITVNITHSIIIDCQAAHLVLLPINNATAFTVNVAASDVVTLRGIDFESAQEQGFAPGISGVNFGGSGSLHIQNCTFRNFTTSGITFAPNAAAKLFVSDSLFEFNGSASTGGGIIVQPQGSGSALAMLDRVRVSQNTFGIAFDGSGSTAGINATVADSVTSGNKQDGVVATTSTGHAPIGVYVKNSKSANNTFGIRSLGPNVTVRVDGSGVTGNGTGLAFGSGGALLSFGNNAVQANGANGAFSGPVALQ